MSDKLVKNEYLKLEFNRIYSWVTKDALNFYQ
jgi:hypothetical protein